MKTLARNEVSSSWLHTKVDELSTMADPFIIFTENEGQRSGIVTASFSPTANGQVDLTARSRTPRTRERLSEHHPDNFGKLHYNMWEYVIGSCAMVPVFK